MVERLLTLLGRERTLGTDIAHQLRTTLTRPELILQADEAHVSDTTAAADFRSRALAEVRTLHTAVEDLLASTGRPSSWTAAGASENAAAVLEAAAERWRGVLAERGRPLRLLIPNDMDDVLVPAGIARQVLGVLLDNAYRHVLARRPSIQAVAAVTWRGRPGG
jgi:signal transduction histidine kinase